MATATALRPGTRPSGTPPGTGRDGRGQMRQEWPLGSHLKLGPYPGAVPCARLHARLVTGEWGLDALAGSTELVVSELVTNAVEVSQLLEQLPPVQLWLRSDGVRVLVVVRDASPRPPVRVEAAADEESGRGLVLVEALTERWGWNPDHGGKAVWCLVTAGALG